MPLACEVDNILVMFSWGFILWFLEQPHESGIVWSVKGCVVISL